MGAADLGRFLGNLAFSLLLSMPALWWARKNPRPWASCIASLALSGLAAAMVASQDVQRAGALLGSCWFLVWLFWQTRAPRIGSGWTRLKIAIAAIPAAFIIPAALIDIGMSAFFASVTLLVIVVASAASWIAAGFARGSIAR